MSGVIFAETLRRNWRQILYWGLGLAILGFYIMVVIPDVDALQQYAKLAENLPPALLKMFGAEDAAAIATPEGFVSFGYFGYTLLILAVYAVIAGLSVTANEEDEGIMDVLLSLPVPRWRVIVEKTLAYALIVVVIILLGLVGLWAGTQSSALQVNMARLVEGTINMIPSTLLMLVFTVFVAVVVRRKSTATAIVAAVIVASYFMTFIGEAVTNEIVQTLGKLSFFSYYASQDVIVNGLNLGNILLLLAATALFFVGSLWCFQRRDVGL
jgi:ABC-2 type transport system permease protein